MSRLVTCLTLIKAGLDTGSVAPPNVVNSDIMISASVMSTVKVAPVASKVHTLRPLAAGQ
ncbi:hypothetical protein B0H14DRAFT_3496017 [Mycena olivaceomarginata]|nr:hypothetical protein B0H14DRAFT_3496017 [Mycena olivaceomarginata]